MLKLLLQRYITTIFLLFIGYLAVLIVFTGSDGLLTFIKKEWSEVLFWLHIPAIAHLTTAYHKQKQLKI